MLGWSIAPDNDLFTKDELVAAFDIEDVNPNPARFDDKKCVAINAEHIRRLDPADLRNRLVPYLHSAGVLAVDKYEDADAETQRLLDGAAPLVQTRIQLLGEAAALMGFLFRSVDELEYNEKAVGKLRDSAPAVLDAAIAAFGELNDADFTVEGVKAAVDEKIVAGMEIKPRFAFAPLFVAMTGTNVSLPVVDSIVLLGKEETLKRLRQFRATL